MKFPNLRELIVLLWRKLIESPVDQIAVTRLNDPAKGEFWASIGRPLIPQEYIDFMWRLMLLSSTFTIKVSVSIICENLIAKHVLDTRIRLKSMVLGLDFTL